MKLGESRPLPLPRMRAVSEVTQTPLKTAKGIRASECENEEIDETLLSSEGMAIVSLPRWRCVQSRRVFWLKGMCVCLARVREMKEGEDDLTGAGGGGQRTEKGKEWNAGRETG